MKSSNYWWSYTVKSSNYWRGYNEEEERSLRNMKKISCKEVNTLLGYSLYCIMVLHIFKKKLCWNVYFSVSCDHEKCIKFFGYLFSLLKFIWIEKEISSYISCSYPYITNIDVTQFVT